MAARTASKKSLEAAAARHNGNGCQPSVFDRRIDSQPASSSKEEAHFLPMIEQPPAAVRKINNLFADGAQSTESVSLPNAQGTFVSAQLRSTTTNKAKVLNLALASSASTVKEKTLDAGSQKSPYGLKDLLGRNQTPTNEGMNEE